MLDRKFEILPSFLTKMYVFSRLFNHCSGSSGRCVGGVGGIGVGICV